MYSTNLLIYANFQLVPCNVSDPNLLFMSKNGNIVHVQSGSCLAIPDVNGGVTLT